MVSDNHNLRDYLSVKKPAKNPPTLKGCSFMLDQDSNTDNHASTLKTLYIIGGIAALLALAANLLDIIIGFGDTQVFTYGTRTAIDWFTLFNQNWFKGLYPLGILNIVYNICMVPVYFAIFATHRRKYWVFAGLVMVFFFIGMAVYLANNAAIPMYVLSTRYAAAGTDAQRAIFSAAGEAILARGEDFTPGVFPGMMLTSFSVIALSVLMLKGRIFGKIHSWIGIAGFSFLTIFTILATFVPSLYFIAFYVFGSLGGLMALTWFALIARRFFQLGRNGIEEIR
jgi:hypothetical protein